MEFPRGARFNPAKKRLQVASVRNASSVTRHGTRPLVHLRYHVTRKTRSTSSLRLSHPLHHGASPLHHGAPRCDGVKCGAVDGAVRARCFQFMGIPALWSHCPDAKRPAGPLHRPKEANGRVPSRIGQYARLSVQFADAGTAARHGRPPHVHLRLHVTRQKRGRPDDLPVAPFAPWSIPLHHGAPRSDGCYHPETDGES